MRGKELMLHLVSVVTETLQKVEGLGVTSIRDSYRLLTWVFLLVCYSGLILPICASVSAHLLPLFPALCPWSYVLLFPKSLLGWQLNL